MNLQFGDSYDNGTYERVLDLDTGTVKVQYSANGVEYMREYFASKPDEVIVMRISVNKPSSLNFTLYLDSKLHHHSYVNNRSQIILEGCCRGTRLGPLIYGSGYPKVRRLPMPHEDGNPKGIQFSAVLDLQTSNGACQMNVEDGRKLRVEGCDWAIIHLTASSSFDGPFTKPEDSTKDPKLESQKMMESSRSYSYFDLLSRHVDDYQALFHRMSLQLSKRDDNAVGNGINLEKSKNTVVTADRIKSFQMNEDPSMVELLFQFGRYLLIACSREGTQASNLQGIWNRDTEPAWECVFCF